MEHGVQVACIELCWTTHWGKDPYDEITEHLNEMSLYYQCPTHVVIITYWKSIKTLCRSTRLILYNIVWKLKLINHVSDKKWNDIYIKQPILWHLH